MNFKTTSELLKLGHGQKIFTGVGVLDNWLHGGIPLGKVYEIVGKPGAGKTQMWQVANKISTSGNTKIIDNIYHYITAYISA